MKLKKFTLCMLLSLCFTMGAAQAQLRPQLKDRQIRVTRSMTAGNPCDVSDTEEIDPNVEARPTMRSTRLYSNIPPMGSTDTSAIKSYVAVYLLTNLGPIGEVYAPGGLDVLKKIDEGRETNYYYPSLLFDMSASPMLSPILTGDKEQDEYEKRIEKVENKRLNLKWMDVTAELLPWCGKDKKCPADALRILEVMPNSTRGGTKESVPAQLSGAAEELAKLSTPFFPATTFEDKATAATGGLTVLFRNLFPPKTETFFHAFVATPTSFGWNYKENKSKPEEASVLGLRRGVALLQADTAVRRIRVLSSALSEWNGPPNPFSKKFDRRVDDVCVWIPDQKDDPPSDYTKLTSLDAFPFLIPKEQVILILHTDEKGYAKLVKPSSAGKPPVLETGPDEMHVKKTSLEKYLGIEKNKAEEKKAEEAKKPE